MVHGQMIGNILVGRATATLDDADCGEETRRKVPIAFGSHCSPLTGQRRIFGWWLSGSLMECYEYQCTDGHHVDCRRLSETVLPELLTFIGISTRNCRRIDTLLAQVLHQVNLLPVPSIGTRVGLFSEHEE